MPLEYFVLCSTVYCQGFRGILKTALDGYLWLWEAISLMKDGVQPMYSTQQIVHFQLKDYRKIGWLVYHLFLKFGTGRKIADMGSGWLLTGTNSLLSKRCLR